MKRYTCTKCGKDIEYSDYCANKCPHCKFEGISMGKLTVTEDRVK